MADAEIHYKLDLIVRLVDTTTGRRVLQRQVVFSTAGQVLPFQQRDDGIFILLNRGRNDMLLEISAAGYLPAKLEVHYEELSDQFPEVEAAMIPQISPKGFVEMLTFEGHCPGLTSIVAVSLKKAYGTVAGYQEKRQILKLFYSKPLEENSYAVIHEQQQEFEEFRIKKRLDRLSVKLAAPLEAQCRPETKIVRIVRGMAEPDGHYLLRVLEDGTGAEYLVRYVVNGKASFKHVSTEGMNLLNEMKEEKEEGEERWES